MSQSLKYSKKFRIISLYFTLLSLTLSIPILGVSTSVQANSDCPVCTGPVPDQSDQDNEDAEGDEDPTDSNRIECSSKHRMHRDCLFHYVKNIELQSSEQLNSFIENGLPCCALDGFGQPCQEFLPLSELTPHLTDAEKAHLALRLRQDRPDSLLSLPLDPVERLKAEIEDAFNLRCPGARCRKVLGPIDGCNGATCSNEGCHTHFCYLCLERQPSARAAHHHVRYRHLQDYFETRPGYLDRYHWLIARKRLASVLNGSFHKVNEAAAVDAKIDLLQSRKMWPMPVGKPTHEWLREVRRSGLTQDQRIELLQNEAIFRHQIIDRAGASQIHAEIWRLGGRALKSLDLEDSAGLSDSRWTFKSIQCFLGEAWSRVASVCCRTRVRNSD